jgi:hypothetical protein
MSTETKPSKAQEQEPTITMTLSELEAKIGESIQKALAQERPLPAQGLPSNTDPSEDRIVKVNVPDGWGLFKCPKNYVPTIIGTESIVEPGKPMYVHVSEDPVATGGGDMVLFRRRIADYDAMNKQAAQDAHDTVKMWENTTPTVDDGKVPGVAQVTSLETGDTVIEGKS